MKKTALLSAILLITFISTGFSQYSQEMNKFALLLYLKNDPQTSGRYEEINTLLSNPENFEKISQCASTAMNYIIARDVNSVINLNTLKYKLGEDFGKPQYEEIFLDQISKCTYDDGFGFEQLPELIKSYPPYDKIKPAADFFILAIKDGQDRTKLYETMQMLYPDEIAF